MLDQSMILHGLVSVHSPLHDMNDMRTVEERAYRLWKGWQRGCARGLRTVLHAGCSRLAAPIWPESHAVRSPSKSIKSSRIHNINAICAVCTASYEILISMSSSMLCREMIPG